MKIGVYGGTFNPPHLGHAAAARGVMELLRLDKLYLIPDGTPPHKPLPPGSPSAEQRLALTRQAAAELGDKVEVLDIEVRRDGRSYTADTLAEVRQRHPHDELWLLVGTDMFLTLHEWYKPGKILSLAGIAAFSRREEDQEDDFSRQRERLYKAYPQARIFTMRIPGVVEISSTEIRKALAAGRGERYLSPAVYGLILREGLYGTAADLKNLPLRQLRPAALSYLNHRRVFHVLGTEQEAIRLALRYGADVERARRAALLHDCTKRLSLQEHLALCRTWGIPLDGMERKMGSLLHAKTGAELAREVFGVDDEIYGAIRYHTTGRAHMTTLEKVIYLADYIEPSRDFPGVEKLRKVCYQDLDKGLLKGLEMTIGKLEAEGGPIHHAAIEARDALKGTLHRG